MGKIRCLAIISISVLMVLTFSGMAGAIGFTYTDTTSKASEQGGITYVLNIDEKGKGTMTVSGLGGDWALNWVELKLKGVDLGSGNDNYVSLTKKDKLNEVEFTAAVPEPSTLLLIGSGLLGLAGYGFARSRKQR
jgi:hypothetical protein